MAFRANTLVFLAALFNVFLGADAKNVKAVTLRGSDPTVNVEGNVTTVDNTMQEDGDVSGLLPDAFLPTVESLGLNLTWVYTSAPWHEKLTREIKLPGLPTITQIEDKLDAINGTLDRVDGMVDYLNTSVNDLVAQVVDGANKTMETLEQIRQAADAAAAFGGEEIAQFISTFTLYMTMQVQDLQNKLLTMVQEQIYSRLELVHTKFNEMKDDLYAKFNEAIQTVLEMMKAAADRLPSADVPEDDASSESSLLQEANNKVPSKEMALERLEQINTTVTTISNLLEGLNLTAIDMVVSGVVGAAKSNLEAIDSQCYGAVEGAGGAVPDAVKPMMKILCSAPLKLLDALQPKVEQVIDMVSTKVDQAIVALRPLREAIEGLTTLVDASEQVP